MTFPIIPSDSVQKFFFMAGVILIIFGGYICYESNVYHNDVIQKINHDMVEVNKDSAKYQYYKDSGDAWIKGSADEEVVAYKLDSINSLKLELIDWRSQKKLLDIETTDNRNAYIINFVAMALILGSGCLFINNGLKHWMDLQVVQDDIQKIQLEILKVDLAIKQKQEKVKTVRYVRSRH